MQLPGFWPGLAQLGCTEQKASFAQLGTGGPFFSSLFVFMLGLSEGRYSQPLPELTCLNSRSDASLSIFAEACMLGNKRSHHCLTDHHHMCSMLRTLATLNPISHLFGISEHPLDLRPC